MQHDGEVWFEAEGLALAQRHLQVVLDMRYVGQNFELSVPLDQTVLAALGQDGFTERLCDLFFEAHERQYGYHNPAAPVEIMNFRATARGQLYQPPEPASVATAPPERPVPSDRRAVYFTADTALTTPVYQRPALVPGHTLQGPAVIEQLDATTLLYPGDVLRVDTAFNLRIEVSL